MRCMEFVEKNFGEFATSGYLGQALDIANILDNPLFDIKTEPNRTILLENVKDLVSYFNWVCLECDVRISQELSRYLSVSAKYRPRPMPFNPGKETKVLIVDDSLTSLMETAMALVGWPNLLVSFYRYKPEKDDQSDLDRAARDIVEINPDIILMDQGLKNIKGYNLIPKIRSISERFIFVANSDADDDEDMINAGCFSNCRKGKTVEGVRNALKIFMNR